MQPSTSEVQKDILIIFLVIITLISIECRILSFCQLQGDSEMSISISVFARWGTWMEILGYDHTWSWRPFLCRFHVHNSSFMTTNAQVHFGIFQYMGIMCNSRSSARLIVSTQSCWLTKAIASSFENWGFQLSSSGFQKGFIKKCRVFH